MNHAVALIYASILLLSSAAHADFDIHLQIPDINVAPRVEFPEYSDLRLEDLPGWDTPPGPLWMCGGLGVGQPIQPIKPIATLSSAKLVYFRSESLFDRNPWVYVHTLKLHPEESRHQ